MADWKEQLTTDLKNAGRENFNTKDSDSAMEPISKAISDAIESSEKGGGGGGGSSSEWKEAIQKEKSEREAADAALSSRIDSASSDVGTKIDGIYRSLNSEIERASTAEARNAESISSITTTIESHTSNTSNPHSVTAEQVNAYTKDQVYTKEEVQAFLGEFGFIVVSTLPPVSEATTRKIYLKGPIGSGDDKYEEWVVNNDSWLLIGETSIDLSPYDKIVDAQAREKVINDALTAHKNDAVAHITAAERTKWNGKQDAITIDSAMSSTSTNPVQNKVVNTALGEAKKYANHSWGGDFRTTLSPLDVYFLGPRNVFLGAYPNAINVEYSTDGGATWLDYGLSDAEKVCLFDFYNGKQIYCGKNSHVHVGCTASAYASVPHDLTNDNIADQRLRITISCTNGFGEGSIWLYCQLRRIGIYMSTQSASAGSTCKFSGRRRQDVSSGTDAWTLFGTYSIQGDSGWNSLPSPSSPFGASYDDQYRELRWEIYSTKLNSRPHYAQTGCMAIIKIIGFSELMWSNASQFRNATSQRYGGSPSFDVFNGLWRGNFEIANKLATARSLGVNLARTAASTFDGSANQLEIPIKGQLADANIASASTWNAKQDALTFTTSAEITEILGGLE